MKKYYLIALLQIFFYFQPLYADMQEDLVQKKAQDYFDSTMSPYCPGRTLSACPSGEATKLRENIRQMYRDGYTEEGIGNFLASKYGDAVKSMPKQKGFDLFAWIMPSVFVFLGIFVIFYFVSVIKKPKKSIINKSPDSGISESAKSEIEKRMKE